MAIRHLIWLVTIARKPVELITWIIAMSLLAFSLYLVSPWYIPSYDRVVPYNPNVRSLEHIVGTVFILGSIPGVVFPFFHRRKKEQALKFATFFMFVAFLFQAILRIVSVGWTPLHWLSVFVIALVCGALRLYLEVQRK